MRLSLVAGPAMVVALIVAGCVQSDIASPSGITSTREQVLAVDPSGSPIEFDRAEGSGSSGAPDLASNHGTPDEANRPSSDAAALDQRPSGDGTRGPAVVRDLRIETIGSDFLNVSYRLDTPDLRDLLFLELPAFGSPDLILGGCFCPEDAGVVDGRQVVHVPRLGGDVEYRFQLSSYVQRSCGEGCLSFTPQALGNVTGRTLRAPLAILDFTPAIQVGQACVRFAANVTGSGGLHMVYFWGQGMDPNATQSYARGFSQFPWAQGDFGLITCHGNQPEWTPGDYWAYAVLRNDRDEVVRSDVVYFAA